MSAASHQAGETYGSRETPPHCFDKREAFLSLGGETIVEGQQVARVQPDRAGITATPPGVITQHDLLGLIPGSPVITAQESLSPVRRVAYPVAQDDDAIGHLQEE